MSTTRPKLRQGHLPKMHPLSNKKLDQLARNYEDARDERMEKSVAEKEAKNTLLWQMIEAKLERYETPDGLVVSVTQDRDVKVKKQPAGTDGDGEEAE